MELRQKSPKICSIYYEVCRMKIIGLTGSIASGKTTLANLFRQAGIFVFDADAIVHHLYQNQAKQDIRRFCKDCFVDESIDRNILWQFVKDDDAKLKQLEAIIHPLVREQKNQFLKSCAQQGAKFVVLDIPLLFETNQFYDVDVVILVHTQPKIQKQRALKRGLSEDKYDQLLAKQISSHIKSKRSHFIIDNSFNESLTKKQFDAILHCLSIF